jgi:WD40 repeat protein
MPATLLLAPLLALFVPGPQDSTPRTRELLSPLRGTRLELEAADFAELAARGAVRTLGERARTHAGGVRSISLDGAGERALSVGSVGDAALTRVTDGESVMKSDLVADDDSAACTVARLLGDGSSAVCLWTDGTARYVDSKTLTETRRFPLGAPCRDVLVSADGRVLVCVPPLDAAAAETELRAFDGATGKAIGTVAIAGGRVLSAALARDGKHVALVALVGRQRVVEVRALSAEAGFGPPLHAAALAPLVATDADFESSAAPLALSADGALLALGARGKVQLFDVARGRAYRALDEDDPSWGSFARALAFDAEGTRLVAGAADGALVCFDVAARRRLWHTLAHAADVTALDLTSAGRTCVSGASDGSLALRDAATGAPRYAAGADVGTAEVLAFAPGDADTLYTGGRGGTCLVFEAAGDVPRAVALGHAEDLIGVARSPEGLLAASASGVRSVPPGRDTEAGTDAALVLPAATPMTAFAAARDGSLCSVGHADGKVQLLRGATAVGELRGESPTRGPVVALGCAPDGTTVLAVASDGARRVWHVDGARLLHETPADAGPLACAVAWLDAARVAVGYADGTAHVERLDGTSLAALAVDGDTRLGPGATQGRTDGAPALAGSPDGVYVAALLATHGLVLFEVETGAVALQLRYAARAASAIEFSDDGTRLVAGHRDGSLLSFDLAALAEWLTTASAGKAAGDGAGAEAAASAALPTLGGEGLPPNSAPPRPDPDTTRVRRRNAVAFDARVALAESAAKRGEDDAAEEQLSRALAELAFDPDSARRAARAANVHQRLAALPGGDPGALGAVADLYIELARAYQRKGWAEVAGLCLDVADVFGPGKGDRVRVALGRAKPAASAGGAQKKPAKPAPKPAAAPKDGAASGALTLMTPNGGWKIEGPKVLALPGTDDPLTVLVDSAPSEDVHLEVVVEASGSRRNEFGVIFGASEDMGSGFALVVLHAENTNVIQAALCELRAGRVGDRIAQRKLTLDAVPKEWQLGIDVKADAVTLAVAGQAKFTIPLERPAHGHHGFLRLAGGAKASVFQRTRIDPPPGHSAATEAKLGPPKVAPDASVEERIVAAEAHVPFGAIEGAVAHLWRAERLLPYLVDESLVPGLAARIGALLATHDALTVRRERTREDATAALVALARARFDAGRPAASLALFELARQLDVTRATEPLESARPGLDLALAKPRGTPIEAPRALDNTQLEAWFAAEDTREEFWVGGWSTVGASLSSPLLVDASSLLRSRRALPEATKELSVEVRLEQRGAAGVALGCGDDGSFLAVTFDPEDPESSITVARWTGSEGQGWDQRAAVRQRYSPEAQEGWTTIHVRLEGTRLTARIGRGEPVSAQVPSRWMQGPPGLLAIGQHGPQRVRFRNFVVK